jgi:hypothetical protein
MKLFSILILFFIFLGTGIAAHAEGGTCPDGYYPSNGPGVMGCSPIPGYNDQQGQPPPPPPPQWESRSGAAAVDSFLGIIGSATDMRSSESAKQSAIANCQAKGGKNCNIELAYSNGCGAIVAGHLRFSTNSGKTQEEAIAKAMKTCNAGKKDPGDVSYSACSLPVRIR